MSPHEHDEHARSWRDRGYIHLRGVISAEQVARTCDAIFEFLEMDRHDPQDWYEAGKRARSGIDRQGRVPFYHHQTLWENRQHPTIYEAYARLLGTHDLLVSIDRVGMNPPVAEHWPYEGFIHWDIDVSKRPLDQAIQGVLCLTDDDGTSGGGFQCVPGFHNELEAWLAKQPAGYATRFPDTRDMQVTPIPMAAGDFLIFHGYLPHGNRPNLSTRPRLAQYFTLFPRADLDANALGRRLAAYDRGLPTESPAGKPFPIAEHKPQDTRRIQLTELGRRLLGSAEASP